MPFVAKKIKEKPKKNNGYCSETMGNLAHSAVPMAKKYSNIEMRREKKKPQSI